ncbi:MAG: hypothetical protein EXS41_10835 [Opitutaceae bacterium]|nr:hypothetical protein [Opitutaceae bacterium]
MNTPNSTHPARRDFFQQSGKAVAASALAGIAIPHVYAAGSETIQLAIIGSGGRGRGAIGAKKKGARFDSSQTKTSADQSGTFPIVLNILSGRDATALTKSTSRAAG